MKQCQARPSQQQAPTLAALYHRCWQIELFFKWIKQHLRIKRVFGTSANSGKTQIWITVSVYVLVAIIRFAACFLHYFTDSESDVFRENPAFKPRLALRSRNQVL
jgi:IS4 transposase